jgi:hypothetical protein
MTHHLHYAKLLMIMISNLQHVKNQRLTYRFELNLLIIIQLDYILVRIKPHLAFY